MTKISAICIKVTGEDHWQLRISGLRHPRSTFVSFLVLNMPGLSSIILASATLLSAAVAIPAGKPGASFSVVQTANPRFKANGPAAYAQAYSKFSKAMPADWAAALGSGTVAAFPQKFEIEYLCSVNIGGQTLSLDFDTGSSDL